MANVRPIKAQAASRDGNGGVTDTPSEFREFETGDFLPVALGGTGATTAGGALTSLGVSAFMQSVLDDADAATARTTLGVTSGGGMFSSAQIVAAPYTITTADANKFTYVNNSSGLISISNATGFANGDIIGIAALGGDIQIRGTGNVLSYKLSPVAVGGVAECLILRAVDIGSGTMMWAIINEPTSAAVFSLTATNGTRNILYNVRSWFGSREGSDNVDSKIPMHCNRDVVFDVALIGATTENFVVQLFNTPSVLGSQLEGKEITIRVYRDGTAGTKTIDFTHATPSYIRKSWSGAQAIDINEHWIFTIKEVGINIYINALKY